jgi:hypothetical protein
MIRPAALYISADIYVVLGQALAERARAAVSYADTAGDRENLLIHWLVKSDPGTGLLK